MSVPDAAGESRVLLGVSESPAISPTPLGITVTGMTLGTLAYAAPEQLNGDPLDGRADQYAHRAHFCPCGQRHADSISGQRDWRGLVGTGC